MTVKDFRGPYPIKYSVVPHAFSAALRALPLESISRALATSSRGAYELDRPKLTITIARWELRKWLRVGEDGKAVEEGVGELLGTGVTADPYISVAF